MSFVVPIAFALILIFGAEKGEGKEDAMYIFLSAVAVLLSVSSSSSPISFWPNILLISSVRLSRSSSEKPICLTAASIWGTPKLRAHRKQYPSFIATPFSIFVIKTTAIFFLHFVHIFGCIRTHYLSAGSIAHLLKKRENIL